MMADTNPAASDGAANGNQPANQPPDSGKKRSADTKEMEEAIGRQVKSLRQRQSLTVRALAERAGISIALLSRVEHGSVSPSLHTLRQIATGLGIPFNHLFMQMSEKRGVSHIRAGKGLDVTRNGSNYGQLYQLLGIPIDGDVQVEPYLITVNEHNKDNHWFQHDGVELIYLLKGCVIYRHGSTNYTLRVGDSLFFDPRVPHGPVEFPKLPAKFLSLITNRRF